VAIHQAMQHPGPRRLPDRRGDGRNRRALVVFDIHNVIIDEL
jgi:hypothetical protein